MKIQKLPKALLEKLHPYSGKPFETEKQWVQLLESLGIKNRPHLRIAIEGGLIGNLIHHGYNKNMVIVSDDAGQFNIFLHALCWVHAERTIYKLIGFFCIRSTALIFLRTGCFTKPVEHLKQPLLQMGLITTLQT